MSDVEWEASDEDSAPQSTAAPPALAPSTITFAASSGVKSEARSSPTEPPLAHSSGSTKSTAAIKNETHIIAPPPDVVAMARRNKIDYYRRLDAAELAALQAVTADLNVCIFNPALAYLSLQLDRLTSCPRCSD